MARIAFNESIGTDRGEAIVGAMVVNLRQNSILLPSAAAPGITRSLFGAAPAAWRSAAAPARPPGSASSRVGWPSPSPGLDRDGWTPTASHSTRSSSPGRVGRGHCTSPPVPITPPAKTANLLRDYGVVWDGAHYSRAFWNLFRNHWIAAYAGCWWVNHRG